MAVDVRVVAESLYVLHKALIKYRENNELSAYIIKAMAVLGRFYDAGGLEKEVSITLQQMYLSANADIRHDLEKAIAIMWMRSGFDGLEVIERKFSNSQFLVLKDILINIVREEGFKLPRDHAMLLSRRLALGLVPVSLGWAQARNQPSLGFSKGGIDLNAAQMNMDIKRDGNEIALPISSEGFDGVDVQGLVPDILNIHSITSLSNI